MKLRPCPFCGSKRAEVVSSSCEVNGAKMNTHNVLCRCNAMGPDTFLGEAMAAQKWNRRRGSRRSLPNKKGETTSVPSLKSDEQQ